MKILYTYFRKMLKFLKNMLPCICFMLILQLIIEIKF